MFPFHKYLHSLYKYMKKSTNNAIVTIGICAVMVIFAASMALTVKGNYAQAAEPSLEDSWAAEKEVLQRELGQKKEERTESAFARDILEIDLQDAVDDISDYDRDIGKIRRRIEVLTRKLGGTLPVVTKDFPQGSPKQ